MKNIFFRVNASVDIGIGHVMRCLALAKSLSINGINCIFLINEDHGGSYELISLEGFEIYFIILCHRRALVLCFLNYFYLK